MRRRNKSVDIKLPCNVIFFSFSLNFFHIFHLPSHALMLKLDYIRNENNYFSSRPYNEVVIILQLTPDLLPSRSVVLFFLCFRFYFHHQFYLTYNKTTDENVQQSHGGHSLTSMLRSHNKWEISFYMIKWDNLKLITSSSIRLLLSISSFSSRAVINAA